MPNNSPTPPLIIEKGREAGHWNDLTNCRGGRGGGLIIDLISDEKGRGLLTSGGNQDSLERHFNYLFASLI